MTTSIMLIADFSDSAAACWPQTARAIADLIATLPEDSVSGIHQIGASLRWEADTWRADMPAPPAPGGSFLAPVMAALRQRRERPVAIVIVGAGEVFDLIDWVGLERGTYWSLVRTGNESLQRVDGRLPEATLDNLEPLVNQLRDLPGSAAYVRPSQTGFLHHHWSLDRTGFPLIRVEKLDADVQLFPLTKPQYEQFLYEAPSPERGDAWYTELLKLNPRLSASAHSLEDYEGLFITGLLPNEVRAYIQWHGAGCQLLTVEQWKTAYAWLATQDVSILPAELERDLSPVARRLWDSLLSQLRPRTLLDLALMRDNVIEWVDGPGKQWSGMGRPRDRFFESIHNVLTPYQALTVARRSKVWGMRLIRRA